MDISLRVNSSSLSSQNPVSPNLASQYFLVEKKKKKTHAFITTKTKTDKGTGASGQNNLTLSTC